MNSRLVYKKEPEINSGWRVEIFYETRRAWTCFFEYLELSFALFFLFFILKYLIKFSLFVWMKFWINECWFMQESSWKSIQFFGRMEIPKSNNKNVFIRPKNLILFLLIWFLRMLFSQSAVAVFSQQCIVLWKGESIFKKQC